MISGDTIVAAATPLGFSGVAVIRVSGPKSFSLAEKVTRKKKTKNRRASLATIYNKENKKIDRIEVLTFLDDGKSLVMVTRKVIERLIEAGARPAEPGEFTQRAFLNGRLDLTQAEAVMDLISAQSIKQLKVTLKK